MALTMRLKRLGRKGAPFYHIVVTDSRNARNGRSIEKIGHYNPMTEPSEISVNLERAVHWHKLGAQVSNTLNVILKKQGVNLAAQK